MNTNMNDFMNQMNSQLNTKTIEPMVALGTLCSNAYRSFVQQSIDTFNGFLSDVTQQVQTMAGAKNMETITSAQSKLVKTITDTMTNSTKSNISSMTSLSDQITKWYESNFGGKCCAKKDDKK